MAAACDSLLRAIPPEADLLTFEPLDAVTELLSAAMRTRYVLLASASKVLHGKRPGLIPVLDSVIASLASADLRGHVLMALANPDVASRRIQGRPLGAMEPAQWSPSALAVASIAMACFEPDPSIVWNDERLTAVRHALETLEADPVDDA